MCVSLICVCVSFSDPPVAHPYPPARSSARMDARLGRPDPHPRWVWERAGNSPSPETLLHHTEVAPQCIQSRLGSRVSTILLAYLSTV